MNDFPKSENQDGVVFACEKIVTSKLYEAGANRRIGNIDTHVGMAAAGLVTDARQLAEIARFFSRKLLFVKFALNISPANYVI